MDALKTISESSMKQEVPVVSIGDTVKVHVRIKEGDKSRIQMFEGTVIAKKHGGISETFTVRRLSHPTGHRARHRAVSGAAFPGIAHTGAVRPSAHGCRCRGPG